MLGVIYDPIHDVGYSAEEGSQLKINREVTQIRSQTEPVNAVVALDFSSEMGTRPHTIEQLAPNTGTGSSVKVYGAPVLSFTAVGTGRHDLFFRPSTKLTDMVAGVCLVRASGGKVANYEGKDWTITFDRGYCRIFRNGGGVPPLF